MTIRCLVVEDQLPARRILARFIGDLPHLELAASCGNGFDAIAALHGQSIDLIFLDLNLPGLSGFDFLRSLAAPPKVIVTTAYPEHAVEGFELQVIDYLLKPIAFDRFLRAIDRARDSSVSHTASVREPPGGRPADPPANEDIFIKVDGAHRRLALADIQFLRGEGDYTSIVTATDRHFVGGSLSRWQERLPVNRFVRTHKSYIVNLACIARITGTAIAVGSSGVPIGRTYRDQLREKLGLFQH